MNLREKVLDIIRKMTQRDDMGIEVNEKSNIFTDLGIDSVMLIKVITEIEEEFDIEFDDDFDYEEYAEIGKIIDYIEEKGAVVE